MIYLDNAATTFKKPNKVYKEVQKCLKKYCGNGGRGGHLLAMSAGETIYRCREEICSLFHIENTMNVSFCLNATQAINMGIKGVLKKGDHVILSGLEHNSVMRPVVKLSQDGVEYSILPSNKDGELEPLKNYIRPNTKLIVICHGSNVLGTVQPIEQMGEIAQKNGVLFMVDAAQTAGAHDIDVKKMNIDILACPGHKGLYGPQGTGILYVRDNLLLDTIMEGGTGSFSEDIKQPILPPDRFESGTMNLPGLAGLMKGVEFVSENRENILSHESELIFYATCELSKIKDVIVYAAACKERCSVLSFNIGDWDSVSVCEIMNDKFKIMLRGGLHCSYLAHKTLGTLNQGTVRMSVSCFNSFQDIEKLIEAVKYLAD